MNEPKTYYSADKLFPEIVKDVFWEIPVSKATVKIPSTYKHLEFLKEHYGKIQQNRELKHRVFNLYKSIIGQKAFEIFENKECTDAFSSIITHCHRWTGNVFTWKKLSRNPHKQIESLIEHLFCKYSVPKFLYKIFYGETLRQNNRDIGIEWLVHLGEGKSARNLPGINFEITKKIAHHFIQAPKELTLKQAVVYAIAKSFNCQDRLITYLYLRRIEDGLFERRLINGVLQKNFWITVIEYFSKQHMFDYAVVGHLVDYIDYIKFGHIGRIAEKPNFEIGKKNLQTLINEAELWQEQLMRIAKAANVERMAAGARLDTRGISVRNKVDRSSWKGMNLKPFTIEKKRRKVNVEITIKELLTGAELLEEGRSMSHCVYSYVGSCSSKKCSIFSLTEKIGDMIFPGVTIEVTRSDKKIVQAKAKGNRQPDAQHVTIIKQWASNNGLVFSNFLRL